MAEPGAATSGSETVMDPLLSGSFFYGFKPMSDKMKEGERRSLEASVAHMQEDEPKEMPPLQIVRFPDLVERAWGWERLVPICAGVEWPVYSKYLQAYHKNNVPEHDAATAASTGTLGNMAKMCLKKEIQLASVWKSLLESHADAILLRRNIVLSCLIKECTQSSILKEGVKSSRAFVTAAFMCIEKETDLILELLNRGALHDDELIEESNQIRMCALSLMGHSDMAAGAMLGISKESSRMCQWMSDNTSLLDSLDLPYHIAESQMIRCRTLDFMASMLTVPYTPAGAAVLKPVMEATDTRGDATSDELNHQDQEKIIDADHSKKRKRIETKKTSENNMSLWLAQHSRHDDVSHCSFCSQIKSKSERAEAGAATLGSVCNMEHLSNHMICSVEALDLASWVCTPHLCHGEKTIPPMRPAKRPDVENSWGFSGLLPFNRSVKWSDYINYLREYYKQLAPEFLRKVSANYPEVYPTDRAGNFTCCSQFLPRDGEMSPI